MTVSRNREQYWEGFMSGMIMMYNMCHKYQFVMTKGPGGLYVAKYQINDGLSVRFHKKYTSVNNNDNYVKVVVEAAHYVQWGNPYYAVAIRLRVPLEEIDSIIDRVTARQDEIKTDEFYQKVQDNKSFGIKELLIDPELNKEQIADAIKEEINCADQLVDEDYLSALTSLMNEL